MQDELNIDLELISQKSKKAVQIERIKWLCIIAVMTLMLLVSWLNPEAHSITENKPLDLPKGKTRLQLPITSYVPALKSLAAYKIAIHLFNQQNQLIVPNAHLIISPEDQMSPEEATPFYTVELPINSIERVTKEVALPFKAFPPHRAQSITSGTVYEISL